MDCLHFEKRVREVTCHLKKLLSFSHQCGSMLRLVCCSHSEVIKNKFSPLKKLAQINLIGRKGSAFKYCVCLGYYESNGIVASLISKNNLIKK